MFKSIIWGTPANSISVDNFLLQYEKCLEYYEKHGIFPKILLVDDIVLSGIDLLLFIEKYTQFLYQKFLKEKNNQYSKR